MQHNKKEEFKLYSPENDLPAHLRHFYQSFLMSKLEVKVTLMLLEFYVFMLAEICNIQSMIIEVQAYL